MNSLGVTLLLSFFLLAFASMLLLIRYWVTGKAMERKSCSGVGSKLCCKYDSKRSTEDCGDCKK